MTFSCGGNARKNNTKQRQPSFQRKTANMELSRQATCFAQEISQLKSRWKRKSQTWKEERSWNYIGER